MSGNLNISLSSEALDSGSPEEQATFGLFAMTVNDRLFTQGIETDSNIVRHGPSRVRLRLGRMVGLELVADQVGICSST